jgi:DNA-binding NarL/FixJ family response regulator
MNAKKIVQNYKGVLSPKKIAVILNRAKRHRLPEDMLEDVLQEIVLEMLTLNYDPNKSYQTNELTVFTSMVDHKILDIVRKIQFEKYFMEKQSHNVETQCDDIAQLQMSMDIQFALKALSTMEQQICMKLATGISINEIAAEKKWSHNKTQRVVSALRRKLTKINLKNYINEK